MRTRAISRRVAIAVAALMVLSTSAAVGQSQTGEGATLADCPQATLEAKGTRVTLAVEQSLESTTSALCRYSNDTGSVKPFIEIHWTPVPVVASDPKGACDQAAGGVVKDGVFWKSRERMVEAAWSRNIPLDGGPQAEETLLVGLVRTLEDKGVGAPCDMEPEDRDAAEAGSSGEATAASVEEASDTAVAAGTRNTALDEPREPEPDPLDVPVWDPQRYLSEVNLRRERWIEECITGILGGPDLRPLFEAISAINPLFETLIVEEERKECADLYEDHLRSGAGF